MALQSINKLIFWDSLLGHQIKFIRITWNHSTKKNIITQLQQLPCAKWSRPFHGGSFGRVRPCCGISSRPCYHCRGWHYQHCQSHHSHASSQEQSPRRQNFRSFINPISGCLQPDGCSLWATTTSYTSPHNHTHGEDHANSSHISCQNKHEVPKWSIRLFFDVFRQ